MSQAGLPYGLNITKKVPNTRPQPGKRKPVFDEDYDYDGEEKSEEAVLEKIGEIGVLGGHAEPPANLKSLRNGPASELEGGKRFSRGNPKKAPISMYGDLSASFTSKKNADTAAELDANIYEYDAVYDSLKPQKKTAQEDEERKPKYMTNLIAAAAVRKRDAAIAEEKKLAREREAEGEEYADKEKFVTSAYKKQQEDNRRLEEEERLKEELEAKKEKGAGMTNFYKNILEKTEQKHAEVMKAIDERAKKGHFKEDSVIKQKTVADLAREINQKKAGTIAVNDEGEVVDKRQLLTGGLNIVSKPKTTKSATGRGDSMRECSRGAGAVGFGGGKKAMRERQTRMMEAQLEQATKRALEQEEDEREKIERASKSKKTEGDIMSAKERYLARKQEAEEAKRRGE